MAGAAGIKPELFFTVDINGEVFLALFSDFSRRKSAAAEHNFQSGLQSRLCDGGGANDTGDTLCFHLLPCVDRRAAACIHPVFHQVTIPLLYQDTPQ